MPQRGDVILYDELIHASIRDGIQMSLAKAYKFKHNDLEDLNKKLATWSQLDQQDAIVYVVTESVFLWTATVRSCKKIAAICLKYDAKLVVDEAHAVGVLGKKTWVWCRKSV